MKKTTDDIIFDTAKVFMLVFLIIVTLYPFLNILAISFNDAMDSIRGGVNIWPRKFSLMNYEKIFSNPNIGHAAIISVLRTVIAVITQVFCTAMVAYTISRKEFVLRKFITLLYVITMYIDGGLIPTYFLMRSLHLVNSFHIYWVPGLVAAFNLLVIRTYINGLSESFIESAKLEGASDFTIFLKVIMPLCLPVLATVALFVAVWQWNFWFDTFIYNSSNIKLSTLQYELMKKIQSANAAVSGSSASSAFAEAGGMSGSRVTPTSLRAAMTVVVSLPIIAVYPFLQKYFVTGLAIGGVKG
ncbi:MAG: carbohydrate ABC transporter permease [Spirochaetales bacterium]|nr:carbohydrate ABC transporter permease [Spirochaetales bacterium]